jgi:hypothetical protein
VNASLFGYSAYHVGDMDRSGTPAVAFSLLVANTGGDSHGPQSHSH